MNGNARNNKTASNLRHINAYACARVNIQVCTRARSTTNLLGQQYVDIPIVTPTRQIISIGRHSHSSTGRVRDWHVALSRGFGLGFVHALHPRGRGHGRRVTHHRGVCRLIAGQGQHERWVVCEHTQVAAHEGAKILDLLAGRRGQRQVLKHGRELAGQVACVSDHAALTSTHGIVHFIHICAVQMVMVVYWLCVSMVSRKCRKYGSLSDFFGIFGKRTHENDVRWEKYRQVTSDSGGTRGCGRSGAYCRFDVREYHDGALRGRRWNPWTATDRRPVNVIECTMNGTSEDSPTKALCLGGILFHS